jgi:hypothetical protein
VDPEKNWWPLVPFLHKLAKRIAIVFRISRIPSGTQALAVQRHGLVRTVARGKTFNK